ncbi:MAG: hypothetical protein DDT37_01917 [Firmicutes bacterium]|nr:hypothetical protein [candidate division NPL-UPA2 bacterium]
MKTENLMNISRADCAAYGSPRQKTLGGKNRRGREWINARTRELESLNKKQPIYIYRLADI